MAKKSFILLKLLSSAGTGYFYTKKKNPKGKAGGSGVSKLKLRKYDPKTRKHVVFEEAKMK